MPPRCTSGRQLLHEPRDALGSAGFLEHPLSKMQESAPVTRVVDLFLPATQPIATKVGTPRVDSAPGLVLNRSDSPGDPTHHHQSRYPKSRLFGYLPDLRSDVVACMNLVMLIPFPHNGYHCLRVQTHHQHSITKAGIQKVDFLGTSQIYHWTSSLA